MGFSTLIEGAAVLLSPAGRVVAMNSEAGRVARDTSYCVLGKNKRLAFRESGNHDAYVKALEQALRGRGSSRAFAINGSGSPVATAVLIPFERPARADAAIVSHVLLVIRQPTPGSAPLHVLQALFGLTGAESSIASALSEGLSVEGAAQALGVTRTTARNQLSAAMAKMGVHRQAELVARVAGLVPRLKVRTSSH